MHLSWIDKLLDHLKIVFVDLFGDQLKNPYSSVVECQTFDAYFDQQLKELEGSEAHTASGQDDTAAELTPPSSEEVGAVEETPPIPGLRPRRCPISTEPAQHLPQPAQFRAMNNSATSTDATPIPTPDSSRPTTPSNVISGSPGPRASRRAKKAAAAAALTATNQSSGDEARRTAKQQKSNVKKGRKWGPDGMADEEDDVVLDYSATSPGTEDLPQLGGAAPSGLADVNAESVGLRTGKGQFLLKDLDDEVHSILKDASTKTEVETQPKGLVGSGLNAIGGMLRNIVGGKVLTEADLDKAMKGMEEHLINKNVAREAAVRLCEGVRRELVGVKTGNFESKTVLLVISSFHINPSCRCRCLDTICHGFGSTEDSHTDHVPGPLALH